jgi:ABC-type branched-subunit amino acid transport system substrate-binding protein
MSHWGQSAREGLLLAQENINSESSEQSGLRVELTIEDYGNFDLGRAVSATQKLITIDKIDILFSYLTEDTEVIWKIAGQHHIPVIAMAAGAADVTEGRPNVYRMSPSDIDLMAAATQYVEARKRPHVCIITQQIAYFESMAAYLSREWTAKSGTPPLRMDYLPSDKDFRSGIAKLKSRSCETVFALLAPDSLAAFLKQAQANQFTALVVGPPGTGDPAILSMPASLTEGVIFARFEEPDADFIRAFHRRFGHNPGLTADYAFDTLTLVGSAMARLAGAKDRLGQELLRVHGYKGASGTIDIQPNRTRTSRTVKLLEIRGGAIKVAAKP